MTDNTIREKRLTRRQPRKTDLKRRITANIIRMIKIKEISDYKNISDETKTNTSYSSMSYDETLYKNKWKIHTKRRASE